MRRVMKEDILLSLGSIVLLGNLNPAIFHPEWFERFKILPAQEIQWAEGERPKVTELRDKDTMIVIQEVPPMIVKPDLAQLRFPSFNLRVQPDRYECVTTQREKFDLVKEVTMRVFSLLEHTPLRSLGINFEGHWKFREDGREITKRLFSRNEEIFAQAFGESYEIGGTISAHNGSCKTTLRLETSNKIEKGVFFNVNFHRDVLTGQPRQAIDLIKENYEKDREHIIGCMKTLIGEPEETWKPQEQLT